MTRARRAAALAVAGLAVVGLGALAAVRLAGVANDLRRADSLVDAAAEALTDGDLAGAQRSLEEAEALVLDANESLEASPELVLLGWLPGVRQNLDGVSESVDLAATTIHGGLRILRASAPLQSEAGTLEVSLSDGTIPLDAVSAAQQEIARLSATLLPKLRSDPPGLLLPVVREARADVHEEAEARHRQLAVLDRGLALLRQIAGGDGSRRYLIAVANTAEMRGSGGMILNYGVLEGRDGVIDLREFGRIDELALSRPVTDDVVPEDYLARWAGFEPLRRFRQANLAGDFTLVAPALEAMFTEATGLPVHGVIQIDPEGLAAILRGVGPVEVPEVGEVTAENVVRLTLNEAYFLFPDVEQRSDVLGDVAEAAFRKLVDGELPSLRTLGKALVDATEGGHILMHATAPKIQEHLVAFGADGAYPALDGADSFALTAQNLSGNKLDYYLDTSLELSGDRPVGEVGSLTARITLRNTAPAGASQPQYVFGPFSGSATPQAGLLRSLVTLYVPVGASLEASTGDRPVEPVSSGTEGGRPYVSFIADVAADTQQTFELDLRLAPRPDGRYVIDVPATPRARPTTLALDIDTRAGTLAGRVELDRAWRFEEGEGPRSVLAPVFR